MVTLVVLGVALCHARVSLLCNVSACALLNMPLCKGHETTCVDTVSINAACMAAPVHLSGPISYIGIQSSQ